MTEGLPILHAPFSRVIKHQMRMKMLSTRETFMKPHAPTRWSVRDDEGTAIAYTRDGVVRFDRGRIAKLRLGRSIQRTVKFSECSCPREEFAE